MEGYVTINNSNHCITNSDHYYLTTTCDFVRESTFNAEVAKLSRLVRLEQRNRWRNTRLKRK